jgi:hypothetical protein
MTVNRRGGQAPLRDPREASVFMIPVTLVRYVSVAK